MRSGERTFLSAADGHSCPSAEKVCVGGNGIVVGQECPTTADRNVRSPLRAITILLASAFCLLPSALSACTVCFGDPSSNLNKGASNGILFMLGIIGFVQIGFIALFVSFWRRAKALRARREQFQLIDGGLQ